MTQPQQNHKCLCLVKCLNSLKVVNVLLNGFLVLVGVCIVIFAGIGLCTDVTYELITTLGYFINFRQCFGIAILVGFFLSLMGSFGILSVVQGHHRRLSISLVFYIILIVLTVAIVLLTWSDKKINMESKLTKSIEDYKLKKNVANLNSLQKLLGCCGNKGPSDYAMSKNETFSSNNIPSSCCDQTVKCPVMNVITNSSSIQPYRIGCSEKINKLVWPIIYGLCAAVDGFMFFTILFIILLIFAVEGSTCLDNHESIKNEEEGDEQEKVSLTKPNDADDEEEADCDGNEANENGNGVVKVKVIEDVEEEPELNDKTEVMHNDQGAI